MHDRGTNVKPLPKYFFPPYSSSCPVFETLNKNVTVVNSSAVSQICTTSQTYTVYPPHYWYDTVYAISRQQIVSYIKQKGREKGLDILCNLRAATLSLANPFSSCSLICSLIIMSNSVLQTWSFSVVCFCCTSLLGALVFSVCIVTSLLLTDSKPAQNCTVVMI